MAGEFSKAEGKRVALINNESVAIKRMYKEALREIAVRIKFLETRANISSVLRVQYLEELRKEIQDTLERIDTYTYKAIVNDMETVAQAVVQDNSQLLKQMGFSDALSSTAFLHIPKDVVNEIITGKLYEGRWSLSRAIWNDNALKSKELETIVAKGVALQKSTYDIAKDLEKYVNPRAQKPWDWGKVYPGVRKVIDYNAQRLARTMVSHAYQESFVRTTKTNPFIEAYKWLISNSDRVCPLCIERSTTDSYNLGAGVYPKDQLPLDHPNGMCTFSIVMVKSYTEIADDLANWVQGIGDKDLNEKLGIFAKELGYEVNKGVPKGHTIVHGKDILETWSRRKDEFAFDIEDVINAQGFDGLPRVVPAKEFDTYVQESTFIAQRTYKAPNREVLEAYREELYRGKWYVDCSQGGSSFGQGMYVASINDTVVNDWIESEMVRYGATTPYAYIETLTLDKSAKIIRYGDLMDEFHKYIDATYDRLAELKWAISTELKNKVKNGEITLDEASKLDWERRKELEEKMSGTLSLDSSSYAALKGYDAVTQSRGDGGFYTIVLNRTKVIIKEG